MCTIPTPLLKKIFIFFTFFKKIYNYLVLTILTVLVFFLPKTVLFWYTIACFYPFAYNSSKHTLMGYRPFMLMYGFQPHTLIDVNIYNDELRSTQNFLRDMQYMLHIARDNTKTTQDRACFYADHNRQPRVFNPGHKVVLHVPHNSKTLSTGKCAKLAPQFSGPFTVLKRIGSSTYHLALPDGVEIHLVFHVSHLKRIAWFLQL